MVLILSFLYHLWISTCILFCFNCLGSLWVSQTTDIFASLASFNIAQPLFIVCLWRSHRLVCELKVTHLSTITYIIMQFPFSLDFASYQFLFSCIPKRSRVMTFVCFIFQSFSCGLYMYYGTLINVHISTHWQFLIDKKK